MEARIVEPAQLFWSVMLPLSWASCWVLTSLSSAMVNCGVPTDNKAWQSVTYLAIFLAVAGMFALRQLIAHGVAGGRWPRVAVLTTVLIAVSVIATQYGVSHA